MEPLREGDIIRYQQIPLNAFSTAQVNRIRSFDDSSKNGVSPLRLSDQYAIQTDQPISRIVTVNYQTGELEDNRKWSHFHNLCDFRLVCFVKCADDRTKIKWNRLGEKAELKSFNLQDIVANLHDRAGAMILQGLFSLSRPANPNRD